VDSVHGSTVDQIHKTKGYAIKDAHRRSDGCGHVHARDGDGSPERKMARQRFASVSLGEGSRPPFCARVGTTCSGEACAGFKREAWAVTATNTGRGQNGHSGEPVRMLMCTKEREKGWVMMLTMQR
jgi:hypothetical protein